MSLPQGATDTVTRSEDGVEIDARVLADAFGLAPHEVQDQMRRGLITSLTERGIDEDEGRLRLVFFHRNARLTLVVDERGAVLQRSVVSFGDHEMPAALRGR